MPRSFATLNCAIWDDEDFCALSAQAQRAYFMITSQRNIDACGTLPLTIRRWELTAAAHDLRAALGELEDARLVLVDERTEELLVRPFMKWDGGYRHPTRLKAIIATARAVRSPNLRPVIATEMAKLGLDSPYEQPPESHPSGTQGATRSDRFPVPLGDHSGEPGTGNLGGEPAASAAPPPEHCQRHPEGTDAPCRACQRAREAFDDYVRISAIAAKEARKNCTRCKGGVWLEDGTKCDHRISTEGLAS